MPKEYCTITEINFLPMLSTIDSAQAIGGIHLMWSLVANDSDAKGLNIWNTPTKLHYLHRLGEKACSALCHLTSSIWMEPLTINKHEVESPKIFVHESFGHVHIICGVHAILGKSLAHSHVCCPSLDLETLLSHNGGASSGAWLECSICSNLLCLNHLQPLTT